MAIRHTAIFTGTGNVQMERTSLQKSMQFLWYSSLVPARFVYSFKFTSNLNELNFNWIVNAKLQRQTTHFRFFFIRLLSD